MIPQILPDACQILEHTDAVLVQRSTGANARYHEQLGGLKRPSRNDDFFARGQDLIDGGGTESARRRDGDARGGVCGIK